MNKRFSLLLAAAFYIWPGVQITQAEEQQLAEPGVMPYITLLDDFTIYATEETKPGEALGSISAFQSVHMAPIASNRLLFITNMDKIPVETWLGKAWINLKEGAYKYGKLNDKEQDLTLLEQATPLYDLRMKATGATLTPQKVEVVASVDACDPYTPCHTFDDWYKWYLIRTSWAGQQWVRPEHYAEKYVGKPVEGSIPVAEETEVYRYPFESPLSDEPKLQPQVLKPVAKYTELVRMTPPTVWYQVDTPKGLRWIRANASYGLGIEVAPVDLQLTIPVPFYDYKTPSVSLETRSDQQQLPQTVHAMGQFHNWYFVIDHEAGRWVNPSKEIASRLTGDFDSDAKLGVKLSSQRLELTGSSIAVDIPYVDDQSMSDNILTFTPQSVTASRVWASPNGEQWYYIHTWQGAKWVRP